MNLSCILDVSSDSLTPFRWTTAVEEDSSGLPNGYFCAAIVLLYLLLGTPWNGFVILIIILKRLYKASPSIILLLNLVVSNFLVSVTVFPFIIVTGFSGEFIFGSTDAVRCGVCWLGALNVTLPLVSLTTLALLSVDRLLYLKKPFVYNTIVTPKRMLFANVLVWIVFIGISIPPFFGFGTIQFTYVVSSCVPFVVGNSPLAPNFYYAMLIAAVAFIPMVTLIVMYVWIVCLTRKHLLRKAEYYIAACTSCTLEQARRQADKENMRKQFRMVQLFGAIFTANLVTWVPMFGLVVTGAITGVGKIPTVVFSIAYLAFLSEIVIHPLLEAMLIREIRDVMIKFWPARLKRIRVHYEKENMQLHVTTTSTVDSQTYENGLHNENSATV